MPVFKSESPDIPPSLGKPIPERIDATLTITMSVNMNPYTAGGWSRNGGRGAENPWGDSETAPPSVLGALPSLPLSSIQSSMEPESVSFQFTNFQSTILNCTVIGPQKRTAYRIVTAQTAPSCTIWKDNESRNVAMVQWQPTATLEIQGVTARQRAREWLRLSPDRRRRLMEVRGVQYAWETMGPYIGLSKANTASPRVLARIARAPGMVLLEVTKEAISEGLLDPSLVATVMLVCGHNID